MAQRGKKNGKDRSESNKPGPSSLTDREVSLLLQTLRPEETHFVRLCEQNKVLNPADAAEALATIPPGAPRDHIGSLLLKAGKISQLEYNVILSQSMAPQAAPGATASQTIAMPGAPPPSASMAPPSPPTVSSGAPTVISHDPAAQTISTPPVSIPPSSRVSSPVPSSPASSQISSPGTSPSGTYFGKYRILSELARGGMGIVYTAKQEELDRVVCLKVLLAGEFSTKDQIERFFQEARSAAKLSNANIVPIFDMGEINGQYYYTMEFIQGRSLDSLIARRPMDSSVVALVALNVAKGLQAAHEAGVIHRDIKPSNVLIKTAVTSGALSPEDWDAAEIKVVDFGLARQVQKQTERLTVSRAIMGTPFYMSPEQARGEVEKVDARSDVYSLGAVMFEMLTGVPPMGDLPLNEILRRAGDEGETVAGPSTIQKMVDPVLEIICMKAMRKNPKRRYGSAGEMAEDLERYLKGEKILAKPPGLLEAWDWKSPKAWAAAAGIVLALGGAVWGVMNYTTLGPPKEISWLEVNKYIGKHVTIELPVLKTFKLQDGMTMTPKPGDKTAFEAVIQAKDYGAFPQDFDKAYWMHLVKITGKLTRDKDHPVMFLTGADQVQVLRTLRGKERGDWFTSTSTNYSPSKDNLINWKNALDNLDQVVTVEGVVDVAQKSAAAVFLDFKRGDKTAFQAVCFESNWDAFPQGFENLYQGKKVWIAGKIVSHQGRPRMYLNVPAQIKIMGEGSDLKEFVPNRGNLISFKDALKYIDQAKTVEGTIDRAVRRENITFLEFASGSKTDFQAIIFSNQYPNFPEGFESLYQGKKVWVSGTIYPYQGRPRITIENPSQIKLID